MPSFLDKALKESPGLTDQVIGIDEPAGEWGVRRFSLQSLYDLFNAEILKSVRYVLVFDTSGSFDIGSILPVNSIINGVVIGVTEVFNGETESTLTIGDVDDPDRFCAIDEVDLRKLGNYKVSNYYKCDAPVQVTGTYVYDSASVGAASIEVFYSKE